MSLFQNALSNLLASFIIPTFLLFCIFVLRDHRKGKRSPPGPKPWPLIGNLHQLGHSPHRSIQRLSKQFGPLMFLKLGSVPTLIISSADVAKEIFKSHDLIFSGRADLYVANKLGYGGNNISFAPYGPSWRELRKISILELLSLKRVQSFEYVREQEVQLVLDLIARSHQSGRSVDLNKLSLLLANNVVCRVTFGKKFREGEKGISKFDEVLHQTVELLGEFNLSDYFPWLRWLNKFNGVEGRVDKVFRELDMLYDEVIAQHLDPNRVRGDDEDIVDVLLRIQKDPSQGISLSKEQIKGVLTDMFVAGTDTSATTIVWAMAELIKNPPIMYKAQAEVRAAAGKKRKVEESHLPELVYLKSIIKEVFRLHPPVPLLVPRETLEKCRIKDYEIPAKARVIVDARALGTDPSCWEDPEEFRPERFLDSPIDFKGQNFELIPFGIGRRGCPGISFAVVLIELTLANLLHRFDWKLPDGMRREDVDMEQVFGLTMFKKTPLSLVATPINIPTNNKQAT